MSKQNKVAVQTTNLAYSSDSMTDKQKSTSYNNMVEDQEQDQGCMYYILSTLCLLLIIVTFPISIWFCFKIVQTYERGVIYRLGVCQGAKGPGLFFFIPCIDSIHVIDCRTITFDVSPQEILTKDSVTVRVDAVCNMRIVDATASINNVDDAFRSTKLKAQTTLRNTLGTKTLAGILSDREDICHTMQESLDHATDPWGIKIESVEIKDVILPPMMQRAMAAEAEAARDAQAKVISAQGELEASKALKGAADVISQSKGAMQLRYLQTLTAIAAERNSTIIFPLPMDILPLQNDVSRQNLTSVAM